MKGGNFYKMVLVKNMMKSQRKLYVNGGWILFKPLEVKEVKHFNGTEGFKIMEKKINKIKNEDIKKEVKENDIR